MRVETTSDPVAFRDAVFDVLRRDPVRNSVMLVAVTQRADGVVADPVPATYLRVLDDDGNVVGTAMRTPPWHVVLGDLLPEAVVPVTEAMARECRDAAGVQGAQQPALEFAERWRSLFGTDFTVQHGLRLHRLGELSAASAPGQPRLATRTDLPLVVDWFDAFGLDVGQPALRERNRQTALEKLAAGTMWLWEDEGSPVSLVGHSRAVYGVSRVGPVYTPPECRGRGYASALTAFVSKRIRDAGDDACLYTDLANPTSNKIYAAIGYEPVGDFVDYKFE
jgi:GNAT superfamily N-acetyltransferase